MGYGGEASVSNNDVMSIWWGPLCYYSMILYIPGA